MKYEDRMMTESRAYTSFKFKVDNSNTDPTVVQAAKVFSFVSYTNLGLVTDRDGSDEIVKAELMVYKDGTDDFDYLLNIDVNFDIKADKRAQFLPNGFKFSPTNENCYLVLNIYEDDGTEGLQKASTMIRCSEIEMSISKLQFRANRAGAEAMDEASLAVTFAINDVSTFIENNPGVPFNQNDLQIDKVIYKEPDCDVYDLCGVVIFGNGFFCSSE